MLRNSNRLLMVIQLTHAPTLVYFAAVVEGRTHNSDHSARVAALLWQYDFF
eukprot:m.376682 g.376682  ORF g.376682 m.376682 type:complete len:51 (+) comp20923_c0_seq49:802-954(+)